MFVVHQISLFLVPVLLLPHQTCDAICIETIGMVQDDPVLLAYIQKEKLNEPASHQVAYDFSKSYDPAGQYGQALEIEDIFKGKRKCETRNIRFINFKSNRKEKRILHRSRSV